MSRRPEDIIRDIERARQSGNTADLERLQSEYRTSGAAVSSGRRGGPGGSVQLIPQTGTRNGHHSDGAESSWPTVTITDGALHSLDADLYDGAERGGYLFGPVNPPAGQIVITQAVIADGDRTGASVVLDQHRAWDIWMSLPSDMTILGDFHQHPSYDSTTQPSSTDIRSWCDSAQTYDKPWVGLVIRTVPVKVRDLDGHQRSSTRFDMVGTVARFENGTVRHREVTVYTDARSL